MTDRSQSRSNLFSFFSKSKTKTSKKVESLLPEETPQDFRAVQIIARRNGACDAVRAMEDKVFLIREAPLLPLQDCTCRTSCACKYKHLNDRRTYSRRDEDNGLPGRLVALEKRRVGDRRKSRY